MEVTVGKKQLNDLYIFPDVFNLPERGAQRNPVFRKPALAVPQNVVCKGYLFLRSKISAGQDQY